MPAPPTKDEIVGSGSTPSNAQARSGFGKLWETLFGVNGLLGTTGNATDARTALGVPAANDAALTGNPTATTQAATDNSTRIATTAWAKLGFVVLFASTGYIKFPTWLGGWLVQWGIVSVAVTTANSPSGFYGATTATFPTIFPTGVLGVLTSIQDGNGQPSSAWQSLTNSNFQAFAKSNVSSNFNVNYLAVGR